MIGVIVEGLDQQGEFSPLIYHRFGVESVIEMTVRNCLNSALIHKVIVAVPTNERRRCTSLNFRSGRSHKAICYPNPAINSLGLIYDAALEHGLDHIVRVHANCPLIPSWLISGVVKRYFLGGGGNKYVSSNIHPGLNVDAFPFWMLADAWTYAEDRKADFVKQWESSSSWPFDSMIDTQGIDLTFNNLDNLERWDYLMQGVTKGHDLEDLLKEAANGDQSGDTEQPSVVE